MAKKAQGKSRSVRQEFPLLKNFQDLVTPIRDELADAKENLLKALDMWAPAAIELFQNEVSRLTNDLAHEESFLAGAKAALEMVAMIETEQRRRNASGKRPPKVPHTEKQKALAVAREIYPGILAGVPEGTWGRITLAVTKVMNREYSPGKKIRDEWWDKDSLRKAITRK